MADAARLARSIGVDGIRFKPARLDKTGGATFSGDIPIALVREWAPSDARLFHAPSATRSSFLDHHCTFLWTSISVYGDGAVAPCCETTAPSHDLGNLLASPFEAIWTSPDYVNARRAALGLSPEGKTAAACGGCKVFRKPLLAPRENRTPLHDDGPAEAPRAARG